MMPVNKQKVKKMNQLKGFTLLEIMIALSLGIIVVGGALSMYISTVRSSSDTIKSARLNYDLDSVMMFMVNDIKRAGYWAGAKSGSNAINSATNTGNPFTIGTANIQIPISSCVLYTYDFDGDGALDDASLDVNTTGSDEDTSEFFGFKLDNGEIKVSAAKTVDGVANCGSTDGRWESIVESNILEITHLQFSFSALAQQAAVANVHPLLPALTATTRCLNTSLNPDVSFNKTCAAAVTDGDVPARPALLTEKRVLNISISGRVKNDINVIKTISSSVQVRNPRIYNQL